MWGSTVWFPDRPVLRWLAKDRWQLTHEFRMPMGGHCVAVPMDFITDLASVPEFFRSLIDEQALGAAAIGHDFLYQNGGCFSTTETPLSRRQCDRQFYQWMKTEGVYGWRRFAAYIAVRLAGWACWRKGKKGTRSV